nr:MBOAT family O-acyltransferase [Helicobacter cinaedi]
MIFNLCLLGIFKYTDFFLENFNLFTQLLHLDFAIPLPHILLPLALSFVTFQQIAFLVDCYKQSKDREETQRLKSNIENNAESQKPILDSSKTESFKEIPHINFLDYCLFITFFPQLIAGPIVHHKEMMPQFYAMSRGDSKICDKDLESKQLVGDSKILELESGLCESTQGRALSVRNRSGDGAIADSSPKAESLHIINWEYIAKGLFIFSIGLFKKVVIADSFAKWANAGFSAVESGSILNLFESWATSLSYTFQLYFDFSGYCDMAIGLGLLFGIVLPINFNSPYKALNIATFWRKWHITLGRFLKEYLYIPLGGNQNLAYKQSRFYVALNNLLTLRNLFIVAFLSGVWHGAGWGFVIWGSLHGLAMVVHRIYMLLYKRLDSKVKDCACSDKAGRLDFKSLYIRFMKSRIYAVLCWILTFNFVNIAWVFFRAENMQGAVNLLNGMFGGDIVLPSFLESRLGFLSEYGIQFQWWLEQIQGSFITYLCIIGAFIVCLGFRNGVEYTNSISYTRKMAVLTGLLLTFCILYFQQDSAFLYFNF